MLIKNTTKAILILLTLTLSSCISATNNCSVKPSVEVKNLPKDLKIERDNVVTKGEVACSF
jgi:ascorbate-specific PTS system EIIC-type component UlaA